jgi:hypothetical protein
MSVRRFHSDMLLNRVNKRRDTENHANQKKHLVKRNAYSNRERDDQANPDRFEEIQPFHNSSFSKNGILRTGWPPTKFCLSLRKNCASRQ